ncbi:MAG TPA: hypothetical protein VFT59_01200 [Candidatus Saccharimonadales bacterium]|nr:hypothetical protein [Candidatus Saccharimonadales bacterium]
MKSETFNTYPSNNEASPENNERVVIPYDEFQSRREARELAKAATPEVQAPPTPVELIGRQSLILFQTRRTTAEAMAARSQETLKDAA